MAVLTDVPIQLIADEVVAAQYPRRRRAPDNPAMHQAAQTAITLAHKLYAPAIVHTELPVQGVEGERVWLSDGRWLDVGPHADLLAPATHLLAAVYTIGPALEAQVERFNRDGDALTAFWLDAVGVMALGQVGEAVRCLAEEKARTQGWGVSAALSPGSLVGWPVQGQRELCALLPLEEIGVRLNRHCVLEPHKSVSMIIGMGPGYDAAHTGSICRLCALRDSCWRRR